MDIKSIAMERMVCYCLILMAKNFSHKCFAANRFCLNFDPDFYSTDTFGTAPPDWDMLTQPPNTLII
jgi:hypothetical protein